MMDEALALCLCVQGLLNFNVSRDKIIISAAEKKEIKLIFSLRMTEFFFQRVTV